jgi:hypothetical protein
MSHTVIGSGLGLLTLDVRDCEYVPYGSDICALQLPSGPATLRAEAHSFCVQQLLPRKTTAGWHCTRLLLLMTMLLLRQCCCGNAAAPPLP